VRFATSIPGGLSKRLDSLVRSSGRTRSDIVRSALAEYIARHEFDRVTEATNRVCLDVGDYPDTSVALAARRVLERTEW
jgi:metal-responsive CopG/Arc/MetJ family transcriptional regulator